MSGLQWLRVSARLGACLAFVAEEGWAQGSLTPPGPPGPTMKTLEQVEPRTPISYAPYTISQAGSYYLTTNLSSAGNGIVIQADQVSLDLMGFSVSGSQAPECFGIWLRGLTNRPIRDVTVRNGAVRGFESGLLLEYAKNSRVERMTLCEQTSHGIYLDGFIGRCDENTITDCSVRSNGTAGVYVLAIGIGGGCKANTIRDCTICDNGESGVEVLCAWADFSGNRIESCAISGNAGSGITLAGQNGWCERNQISDCLVWGNTGAGITLSYANGNRIENNHVAGTTGSASFGIRTVSSSANVVVRNTCIGQTNNFVLSANDTCGPVVKESGPLSTTNGAAALSPWANFSR